MTKIMTIITKNNDHQDARAGAQPTGDCGATAAAPLAARQAACAAAGASPPEARMIILIRIRI